MEIWEFIKSLTNPETIIQYGGLVLILLIVFAENGILFGFFLPGDSLIFLAGLICSTQPELLDVSITTLSLSMFGAAVAGSLFGYYFGMKVGPPVFERNESMFFKKKYVDVTRSFYEKHGGKTLVLGRFLPIIRTFAPILAGVIKVEFKTFMLFNVIGGALWIFSLSLIGYFLGNQFPNIKHYVEYIVLGFILITTVIVIRTYIAHRKEQRSKKSI
ncbi:MAG: DedA family protein [Flavobacteriales bacterium]|jgi:membrane-associated protein